MSDPNRNPLKRQGSKTSLEQSLKMISPPQQAPITIYPGPSAGMATLSKADLEIAQRLQNLRKKSHSESVPTEQEMASRLAQLKGLPTDHYDTSQNTSAAAASYQRPDVRPQGHRADDLLQQVMEEVSLDARAPNPDDELEARLARLRGEEPRSVQPPQGGAMALPPNAYHQSPSQARAEATLGEDLEDISMDEVEALMHAAEKEAHSSAEKAVADLQADPALAQAVAQATRKKEKKGRQKKSKGASGGNGDTSDEERRSKSYGDSDIEIEGGKAIDAVTEQEEVQRIIDMYTKRAQLKKEKKRKKKEAAAAAAAGGAVGGQGDDSDSDIEVNSSESDLSSDSEKFSESDELSD